jgi:acetyl esterase/lipase
MTRKKFSSYLNISLISDEYKLGKSYYNETDNHNESESDERKKRDEFDRLMSKDPSLKAKLASLFEPDMSPSLVDDEMLRDMPMSYFVILEWDGLKDEGLIYAERLRRNNCQVKVAYYENAFHGILPYMDENYGYKISNRIFDEMTDFIKNNV